MRTQRGSSLLLNVNRFDGRMCTIWHTQLNLDGQRVDERQVVFDKTFRFEVGRYRSHYVCVYMYNTEMSNQQVMEALEKGQRHPQPANCPREMYDIMLTCWKKSPEERPTFEHLFHTMDDYNVAVASSYAET